MFDLRIVQHNKRLSCFSHLSLNRGIIFTQKKNMVGIIMGSKSDLPVMQEAADVLKHLGVEFEITIVSAHRTPERMFEYAQSAVTRGLMVIIAGAGGAAHLPGMTASLTPLPVIGVPIKSSNSIDGWDSVLSILQMPAGVPVATVALNGARNAGILAAQIIGAQKPDLLVRIAAFKEELKNKVMENVEDMKHSATAKS
jgi:5-(carboxyamino)imidazole ribonucleotide mutase